MLLKETGTTKREPYLVFVIINFVDFPSRAVGNQDPFIPITKSSLGTMSLVVFHVFDLPDIGSSVTPTPPVLNTVKYVVSKRVNVYPPGFSTITVGPLPVLDYCFNSKVKFGLDCPVRFLAPPVSVNTSELGVASI